MKRAGRWDKKYATSSDDSDSDLEDDGVAGSKNTVKNAAEKTEKYSNAKDSKRAKSCLTMDYEALSQHGYSGGLSILKIPPPPIEDEKQDWSWSTGKHRDANSRETAESIEIREQTRATMAEVERLANARVEKGKKNLSFSQKEKRKRELGQASRGKNYVEEEKRLLRDNGIYSGFDS